MTPIKAYQILFKHYRNIILYALIGLSALSAELGVFYALSRGGRITIVISNAMAMGSGFFISFLLNAYYNFGVKNKLIHRLVRFGIITFCGYWLSTLMIVSLIDYGQLSPMIAKACSLPVLFAFQYLLNKQYTFQPTHKHVKEKLATDIAKKLTHHLRRPKTGLHTSTFL